MANLLALCHHRERERERGGVEKVGRGSSRRRRWCSLGETTLMGRIVNQLCLIPPKGSLTVCSLCLSLSLSHTHTPAKEPHLSFNSSSAGEPDSHLCAICVRVRHLHTHTLFFDTNLNPFLLGEEKNGSCI